MSSVISSAQALSPEILTGLLRAKDPEIAGIKEIQHETVGFGLLGDSVRFTIGYDGAGRPGPASLVGKFSPADLEIRQNGAAIGIYNSEVGFYREIADTVAVRRPEWIYADVDESGAEFGLIMEDLGPARACDQLSACSMEDAFLVVQQAAALHGPRWNDPTAIRPWMLHQQQLVGRMLGNFGPFVETFIARFADGLEPAEIAVVERFGREAAGFFGHRRPNRTIVHSDLRLDNILFDAAGGTVPIAILDWQSIVPGSGAIDVGFFASTSLPVEARRKNEQALLELYLDQLRSFGVSDYSFDALWLDYRLSSWQALFTAISASYSAKRTERAYRLFTHIAKGGVALLQDMDAFATLAAVA